MHVPRTLSEKKMKKIQIIFIFCMLFFSACQSGKLRVLDASAQIHSNTLASALKSKEISCNIQLSKEISEAEWRLQFALFRKGELINNDDDSYDRYFTPEMFGGFIGTPIPAKKKGKPVYLPNDKIKFDNIKMKLFFINLEYINLNEKVINRKYYKVSLSVEAGKTGFGDDMLLPKAVMDLGGADIGTFPDNFKYPKDIIPIFYLREANFCEEWEMTEESLPSPKNDLNEFITAKYPDTVLICFLVKDFETYLDFLEKYHPDNEEYPSDSASASPDDLDVRR